MLFHSFRPPLSASKTLTFFVVLVCPSRISFMKRFLAILHARNMEFIRDKSSLGWNILFPLLLVLGFAAVFSGPPQAMFKVGVIGDTTTLAPSDAKFLKTKYVQFITVDNVDAAVDKVGHFQLDMLLDLREGRQYWINENSPNGYVLERMIN